MYSLALALEDFVPVVLSAFGLIVVARLVRGRSGSLGRVALLAAALIVLGGTSRAAWKVIVAGAGPDVAPLYLLLFPALVVGYLTIASATWSALRGGSDGRAAGVRVFAPAAVAIVVLVPLTVAFLSPESRIVPLSWLLASVIGSGWLSLALALEARRTGRPSLAWLFALNLLITLTLNGVARASQAPEAIQWVQQIINTANQFLFLVAVRRLAVALRETRAPEPEATVADAAA